MPEKTERKNRSAYTGVGSVQEDSDYQRLLTRTDGLAMFFLSLAILMEYVRPQSVIPAIGFIKFPMLVNVFSFLCVLPHLSKNWNRANVVMVLFLIYNAIYIVVGRFVVDEWVVNDGRALFGLISLLFSYFSISIVIAKVCLYKKALFGLAKVMAMTSALLGIYALTHGGKGPTGWVGDENDCCFALLTVFPFCIFATNFSRGVFQKTIYAITNCLSIGAIVFTFSRGGFVALVASFFYLVWQSPQRLKVLLISFFLVVMALPFVPGKYWEEMSTITETKSGTALQRREYWTTATKVWLYKGNVIFGVGMGNAPYWLENFQEDKITRPSFAGRQVHSTYLQLLADLGLIGALFFFFTIGISFIRTFQIARGSHALLRRLRLGGEQSKALCAEFVFIRSLAITVNMAYLGGLIAAVFVSVLYYPPLWVLMGVCAALEYYYGQVIALTRRYGMA